LCHWPFCCVRKLSAPVVGLAGARAVKRFGAPAVKRLGAPAVKKLVSLRMECVVEFYFE